MFRMSAIENSGGDVFPPGSSSGTGPEAGQNTASGRDKAYNRIKLRVTVAGLVINFILLALFAFSGISPVIVRFIESFVQSQWGVFLLFLVVSGAAFSAAGFPLDYYSGFVVEHRYALSNQSPARWLYEKLKSSLVGMAIGLPVALVFYYLLSLAGPLWWLYFAVFLFFVSVLLARVAPVIIFPLFYRFTELEDGEIKNRIMDIVNEQGVPFKGIFTFNMSKNTRKANAGFTGIGRSKRIILSDTLVEQFTPDEIAVIFAHEMGHYRRRHILKNIVLSTVIIFLSLYSCASLHARTIASMGFARVHDVAAIPVLLFYLSVLSFFLMPLTNAISRRFEVQADTFALETTRDRESFISSMDKLAAVNLADRDPHPLNEFFFYSHPSIGKRIAFAREYKLQD